MAIRNYDCSDCCFLDSVHPDGQGLAASAAMVSAIVRPKVAKRQSQRIPDSRITLRAATAAMMLRSDCA
jgi:shikimate kinase